MKTDDSSAQGKVRHQGMQFEWDAEKATANARKHRVTFEEGETVFRDPFSLTFPDLDHRHGEHRYIEIGLSARGRLLIVSYTERQGAYGLSVVG
jgi:uncharacterized protein